MFGFTGLIKSSIVENMMENALSTYFYAICTVQPNSVPTQYSREVAFNKKSLILSGFGVCSLCVAPMLNSYIARLYSSYQRVHSNSSKTTTKNISDKKKQNIFFLFLYWRSKMYCSHSTNNQHVSLQLNVQLRCK